MNINNYFGVSESVSTNELLRAIRAHLNSEEKIPDSILVSMLRYSNIEVENMALRYIFRNMKEDVFKGLNIPPNVNKENLIIDAVTTFWQFVRYKNRDFDTSREKAIVRFLRVVCWRMARRGGKITEELPEEYKFEEEVGGLDDILMENERRSFLLRIFDTLGKGCKEILRLFYFEQYSYKEIAEITNYEKDSAKVRRNRCIQKLKEQIVQNDTLAKFIRNLLTKY